MSRVRKYLGTSCKTCKTTFTKTGPHSYNSKGKCRKCYQTHLRDYGFSHCEICKQKLPCKLTVPYCKLCKIKVKTGELQSDSYKPSKRSLRYTNYSEKVAKRFNPTPEFMTSLKLVLILWKNKMLDRPDSFRVVHHYIEIWGYEASLDSVEPDKQVEFMAKRLNEWYKGNKDLIYTV